MGQRVVEHAAHPAGADGNYSTLEEPDVMKTQHGGDIPQNPETDSDITVIQAQFTQTPFTILRTTCGTTAL